jgi:hypothetical protein
MLVPSVGRARMEQQMADRLAIRDLIENWVFLEYAHWGRLKLLELQIQFHNRPKGSQY